LIKNIIMKRRDFVKGMSAAVAAGVLIPNPLHALGFEKVIGIQLYTLRDLVNEIEKDVERACSDLKEVADDIDSRLGL